MTRARDLAGRLQAQVFGALRRRHVIRTAEPDGEFGIAGARHQVGRPHRALQQHRRRGAAPDRCHPDPAAGRHSPDCPPRRASACRAGRRDRAARCGASPRRRRNAGSAGRSADRSASTGNSSRWIAITIHQQPDDAGDRIDQRHIVAAPARRAASAPQRPGLSSRCRSARQTATAIGRPFGSCDSAGGADLGPPQQRAGRRCRQPIMPARCRTSGSAETDPANAADHRRTLCAECCQHGVEAGRHQLWRPGLHDAGCEGCPPTRRAYG